MEKTIGQNAAPYFAKDMTEESSIDEFAGNFKNPLDLDENDYDLDSQEVKDHISLSKNHTPLGLFAEIPQNQQL